MKKLFKVSILLFIVFISHSIHAITLGEYEAKLNQYKAELNSNNAKINSTNTAIAAANNRINTINKEVNSLLKEKEVIIKEMEDNKVEIDSLKKKTKKLIEYYQMSKSGNFYIDYIFDSKDISTFIYRYSVVDQFLEYTKNTTKNLSDTIKKQEQRQKDIINIQGKLANKKNELDNQLVKLGTDKAHLVEGGVSIKKQVEQYDEIVNYYKKKGCKSNHVIGVDCAKDFEAGIFRRPMRQGYVTGYQGDIATYGYFHQGVDISSSNKREPIYAVANGKVVAVYTDGYGGKTVIMTHYKEGKYYTSVYIHMDSYGPKIKVGNDITSDDLIGYMGSSGWATGPHLHLEIVPCRYYFDHVCRNWWAKDKYIRDLAASGYRGAYNYISLPNRKYEWFRGR